MEPDQIVKSVIDKLSYLRDVPVNELEAGLDEVKLKIVELRDHLIEKCRDESCSPKTRDGLRQVTLALSLIFGLEYPVTGFQRNKIKQTIEVLSQFSGLPA